MHPRNRLGPRYDFPRLIRSSPELAAFVRPTPYGADSIDFADPAAVVALNYALLRSYYGIAEWEIPPGYLCPAVPGRADYIHHAADLLARSGAGPIPRGPTVGVLDIGVGASGIYPIIGVKEYGWRFVATDIDASALASTRRIVAADAALADHVECRLQSSPAAVFKGIVRPGEVFELSMCNPPFHASAMAAATGTARKVRNLTGKKPLKPLSNFGGQSHELWCPGGEATFVRRMIAESAQLRGACRWFSTLVSKRENLPAIYQALKVVKPADVRTLDMEQGNKQSRMVAWTFLGPEEHLRPAAYGARRA